MTELGVPSMNELFDFYRELSRNLHDEAKAAGLGPSGCSAADVATRLESKALELDRVIATFDRR